MQWSSLPRKYICTERQRWNFQGVSSVKKYNTPEDIMLLVSLQVQSTYWIKNSMIFAALLASWCRVSPNENELTSCPLSHHYDRRTIISDQLQPWCYIMDRTNVKRERAWEQTGKSMKKARRNYPSNFLANSPFSFFFFSLKESKFSLFVCWLLAYRLLMPNYKNGQ